MLTVHFRQLILIKRFLITISFSVFILISSVRGISANNPEGNLKGMEASLVSAGNDSLRIEALFNIAYYYFDFLGEKKTADSISRQAVDLAQASYHPHLLILAYNRYIECNDLGLFSERANRYAQEAVKLCRQPGLPELEWRTYSNLVEVQLAGYSYNQALGNSYQALAIADTYKRNDLKARSYLLIGRSLEGNNQKIEAFRNYLNAVSLAESMKKPELMQECYSRLSSFYNFNKLFDKAIEYKLKQVEVISKQQPVDSTALMWTQYDLQAIQMNSNNNNLSIQSVKRVLDYAQRKNFRRLLNYEIALYRTNLIEANKIDELYAFYTVHYPSEFRRLLKENPALFFRLNAYFKEKEGHTDSAMIFLTKAEGLMEAEHNKIMLSKFYYRLGQFLERHGQTKEAILKLEKSFLLAEQASYLEYMVNASRLLETLYLGINDYRNAYAYSSLNRTLSDSLAHISENDELMRLEIEHEAVKRENLAHEQHEQLVRNHSIQYTAITIIIIALFIILLMLGSLKVPEWTIRMLGFFSFILFFEFIIMIADHKIYEITANEPWKILLIKIGLIAFLLPFHHWIEKQVIHYLIHHKLIDFSKVSIRNLIRREPKKPLESDSDLT